MEWAIFFTEKQNISIDIRIKKVYNVIKVKARRLNQSTILTERTRGQRLCQGFLTEERLSSVSKKRAGNLLKEEGKEAMRVSRKAINSFPFLKTEKQLEKGR